MQKKNSSANNGSQTPREQILWDFTKKREEKSAVSKKRLVADIEKEQNSNEFVSRKKPFHCVVPVIFQIFPGRKAMGQEMDMVRKPPLSLRYAMEKRKM